MNKASIVIGEEYAVREARKPNAPLQHVRILEHVRGSNYRAEWIEPNPGLVDYVHGKLLLVRWKDHRAFLRDEECRQRLVEDNKRQGFEKDSPLDNAVTEVFEATGDRVLSFYRGILSGPADALERVRARARFDKTKISHLTYTDRLKKVHVPFVEALELARAFAAAEPSAVLAAAESTERQWAQDARQPGKEHLVGLLNEYRACWAIVRQWAGQDAAIAEREARIQELERIVWDAIYALQKAGEDEQAARLRRLINRN